MEIKGDRVGLTFVNQIAEVSTKDCFSQTKLYQKFLEGSRVLLGTVFSEPAE